MVKKTQNEDDVDNKKGGFIHFYDDWSFQNTKTIRILVVYNEISLSHTDIYLDICIYYQIDIFPFMYIFY